MEHVLFVFIPVYDVFFRLICEGVAGQELQQVNLLMAPCM